ncbi:MAG TPA: hypothetical protein VGH33_05995, partial [Isosphaeraceae bacterium]
LMDPDPSDPVIDEIREIRHRISARFDHDPARLVAYYMELQKKFADRFVKAPEPLAANHPGTPPASPEP